MDVERYLLSSALTGIVSQKLARKLCPHCRIERETTQYEKKVFKEMLNKDVDKIWDVNGSCDKCRNGYVGRIAVQEVLLINDEIRNAINDSSISREQLQELVYTDDVTTLLQDGLNKVLEGITTFEEIYKIIEIDDELDALIEREEYREQKALMKEEKNENIQTINNIQNNESKTNDTYYGDKTEILDLSQLS